MDISQLLPLITSLASALAAVLAWIAKVRWADEYSKAKDETIKAKDAVIEIKEAQLQTLRTNMDEIIKAKDEQIKVLGLEIKSLSELTPMKIREYFLSVREQMEEYNSLLKKQLDDANKELGNKKKEIDTLRQEGEISAGEIEKLEVERENIASVAKALEEQISVLRKKYESDVFNFYLDPEVYKRAKILYKKLSEGMLPQIDDIEIPDDLDEQIR
jgi:chromosome segregation ATPase